jgi:hypothetical protein
MPEDKFVNFSIDPTAPACDARAITPSDSSELDEITLGLNVATTGQVRVTTLNGTITDLTLNSGFFFPIRVSKVWTTGTTATGIRGLF